MALQGPRCQGNQAIAERAQEDEEEQREWSDDSDVPEDELADRVTELSDISKTAQARAAAAVAPREASQSGSKTAATSTKGPRGKAANAINFQLLASGDVMHVVFVVDASASMGTNDVEWVDPSPELEMMPPRNVRRIDAVMLACRAFLKAHRNEPEGSTDFFSLVTFNDAAKVLFERKTRKAADRHLQKAAEKVSPVKDTRFQSAFRGIRSLLREESALEDVRVVLLSDGQPFEKDAVMKLFEEILLTSPGVRLLVNFEVHTIGFGVETNHWNNLKSLAEATKGTFQVASLKYLELTKSFTSVAATITRDQSASSAPLLKAAALDIPFDPDFHMSGWADVAPGERSRRVFKRTCAIIEHKFHERQGTFVDEAKIKCSSSKVMVDQTPFNFGGMRLVYGMVDTWWKNREYPMVAKRLIKEPHASLEEMRYFCRCTSMAISTNCRFRDLARRKNVELPAKIFFVPCYLYKYQQADGTDGFFVGEQRLDDSSTEFTKFNGNNGYVNPKNPPGTELMQAFSHFSFIRSKGTLLVVDIQGILDNDTFLLTDPQVHSRKQVFGRGDLGVEGFQLFFKTHRCGETCKALGLQAEFDKLLRQLQLEKDRRCQICMDAPSKTVLLPCNHSAVCQDCAQWLMQARPVCPICRRKVTEFKSGVFSSTFVKKRVSFGE